MAGSPKRLEAVIFDLDDTLIDWSDQSVPWPEFLRPRTDNIHRYLISEGLSPPSGDDFFLLLERAIADLWDVARQTWRITSMGEMMLQLFSGFGFDALDINIDEVLLRFDWQPFPGVKLFDESLALLSDLRERQYKLGLLTNSFLPMWMRDVELRAYGIIDFFDARLTAADVGYIKPHPAIFQAILSRLETKPEETAFVGDRPRNDIAGANEAGMLSILISPPHLDRELDGVVPDHTVKTLSEILPILDAYDSPALRPG